MEQERLLEDARAGHWALDQMYSENHLKLYECRKTIKLRDDHIQKLMNQIQGLLKNQEVLEAKIAELSPCPVTEDECEEVMCEAH